MKLIRCRKCGAALVTEDALIERMNDTIHELNEKARHSKNGKIAKSYLAEAASVTKMMKGILHNTAQMEARKSGSSYELSEIVHYIRENDLISDEKLDELRKTARERAKIRNEENQKEIDRIYGKYRVTCVGCVPTDDINLIDMDTDGDVVKESIKFGAKRLA